MKKFLVLFAVLLPFCSLWADPGNAFLYESADNDVATFSDTTGTNLLNTNFTTTYTFEVWIKLNSYGNDSRILQRRLSFALYIDAINHSIVFQENSSGTAQSIFTPNNSVFLNQWHHVAVRRFEETAGVFRTNIFLDGVKCASSSTHANFALPAVTDPLLLGNNLSGGRSVNGYIDEIRLWTTGRTDAEIANTRGTSLTGAEPGLFACYSLDEALGTQIFGDLQLTGLALLRGTNDTAETEDPQHVASSAPIGYKLIYPNGGGGEPALVIGNPLTVLWAVDAAVPQVNVYFWQDNLAKWRMIAYRTPNDGAFETYVPGYPTTAARFRVCNALDELFFDDSDGLVTILDPGGWQQEFFWEAEDADLLTEQMEIGIRGKAFQCQSIFVKQGSNAIAEYNFTVTHPGVYIIWGRMFAPGGTRNSWWVSMDGGTEWLWDLEKGPNWRWQIVSHRGPNGFPPSVADIDPVYVTLAAGAHKLSFRGREPFAEMDQVLITNDLNKRPWNAVNQWIQLISPYDREHIAWGDTWEIRWASYNISNTITIELSFDEGETYPVTIAQNTPNDGSFLWQVPNYGQKTGWLRISDGWGGGCPWDETYWCFYFKDPEPGVRVVKPNGGEVLNGNTFYDVSWTSLLYNGKVTVEVSLDSGATWDPLGFNMPSTGTIGWAVPNVQTDEGLVRVYDTASGAPSDTSDNVFSIVPQVIPENITVIFPNGGEVLVAGNAYDIWWDSDNYLGLVNVELSLNNGGTWTTLATNQPHSGKFNWIVPQIVANQALVKVMAVGGNPQDTSDNIFTIVLDGGAPNHALHFDGNDDYVRVPHDASLNVSQNFTIEFWLKTENPFQADSRILEKGNWDEYFISFYDAQATIAGALRTVVTGDISRMKFVAGPTQTVLLPNTWYHIAVTYNGTFAKIFVDGVEEASKPALVAPRKLLGDLIIGAVDRRTKTEAHFQGTLDDLHIWNIAKTPGQIAAQMYAQPNGSEAGLVACFNFDEGAGQTAGDLSPFANNGQLGTTPGADAADPLWVDSDRPPAPPALASAFAQTLETELSAEPVAPDKFQLLQNYPNPFNGGTTISFAIPVEETDAHVKLDIFDVHGRTIKTLTNTSYSAGVHEIYWNGTTDAGNMAASGIYFYRIQTGKHQETRRMVYLK
ncbi:T9SS type A sorting domain-containing protein [candidate division KSB1 bacterium]|nr:T9SS type A sorting domain-containing protein [candidate division KSB1 bacterium]